MSRTRATAATSSPPPSSAAGSTLLLGGLQELSRGSLVAECGRVLRRQRCVLVLVLAELGMGSRFGALQGVALLESGGGHGQLRGCRAPPPLADATASCGGARACCELQRAPA